MHTLYCDCGEVIGTVRPATQEEPEEAEPWNESLYDDKFGFICRDCFERLESEAA